MTVTNGNRLWRFLKDERGAVAVDWVVLTAAVVGLGILVVAGVSSGTNNLSLKIQTALMDMEVLEVVTSFSVGAALSSRYGTEAEYQALVGRAQNFMDTLGVEATVNEVESYLAISQNSAGGDAVMIDAVGVGIQVLSDAGHDVGSELQASYQSEYDRCVSSGAACANSAGS
ncbi:hypothetical protein GCM10011517_16690 [Actibacterium pelagium]|uniref:Uncharacterized protein n=2 Tax=Actibacterium pelagium TaxID=2029103 RepID=A0A917EKW9_9RHOB|nr:hypothetical protein [Actibacterium pelagium]GGE49538.1 hypothetical protein GCM10011517_16690 [Actibacterium pelagium]